MLMTPALAFFYGGLVRRKNLVSTLVQCMIIFAVISLIWFLWGYSLVYGPSVGGVIGNLSLFGLNNITISSVYPSATAIPEILFFAFQLKFAAITPALILGACAERIRFKSLLVFVVLWSTLIYSPIAMWVWNPSGWLHVLGAVDFAGGIVVHIAAGVSALAAAVVLGRRQGCVYWKDQLKALDQKDGSAKTVPMGSEFKPTNIPYVILGAGLLWFGWFGFNGGSALAANGTAVAAVISTNLAAAAAAVSWMLMDWTIKGKPSAIGIAVGAVCGLAAVTAASGYVSFWAAVVIGLAAGIISNLVANWRAARSKIDDSLDVFACHGIGGIIGAIAIGIFATTAVNPAGVTGLIYGNVHQFAVQLLAVGVVSAFAFGGTYILLKIVDRFSPLRVSPKEEEDGLDMSQHGEEAYHLE
jgi:Amt family ammonium transporter